MPGMVVERRTRGLVLNQFTITFIVSSHRVGDLSRLLLATNTNALIANLGGTMGHMSYVDYSAFDPIFWLQ